MIPNWVAYSFGSIYVISCFIVYQIGYWTGFVAGMRKAKDIFSKIRTDEVKPK